MFCKHIIKIISYLISYKKKTKIWHAHLWNWLFCPYHILIILLWNYIVNPKNYEPQRMNWKKWHEVGGWSLRELRWFLIGILVSIYLHWYIHVFIFVYLYICIFVYPLYWYIDIPDICHFFYTSRFWGLKILHSKVRKFATICNCV